MDNKQKYQGKHKFLSKNLNARPTFDNSSNKFKFKQSMNRLNRNENYDKDDLEGGSINYSGESTSGRQSFRFTHRTLDESRRLPQPFDAENREVSDSWSSVDKDAPVAMSLQRNKAPPLWKKSIRDFKPVSRTVRDPRFDDLSGTLDDTAWSKNYAFLKEIRETELKTLRKELDNTRDQKNRHRIKLAIQKIQNQDREKKKMDRQKEVKQAARQQIIDALKQGKKPYIKKNSVSRLEALAEKFHALKKEHRLDKYMQKREKKMRAQELFK